MSAGIPEYFRRRTVGETQLSELSAKGRVVMLYAVLLYENEKMKWSRSPDERAAADARLQDIASELQRNERLCFVAGLHYTTTAITIRRTGSGIETFDGPNDDGISQLAAIFVINGVGLGAALEAASRLADAAQAASCEVRPLVPQLETRR